MTKVINGYAQPDIVAEKGKKKIVIFVETPSTMRNREYMRALARSYLWLRENEPKTRVDLVHTKPKGS